MVKVVHFLLHPLLTFSQEPDRKQHPLTIIWNHRTEAQPEEKNQEDGLNTKCHNCPRNKTHIYIIPSLKQLKRHDISTQKPFNYTSFTDIENQKRERKRELLLLLLLFLALRILNWS